MDIYYYLFITLILGIYSGRISLADKVKAEKLLYSEVYSSSMSIDITVFCIEKPATQTLLLGICLYVHI